MRYLIIAILLISCIVTPVFAKQEYNAMEDRWETVPDNSDWDVKYNAMENEWSYQPEKAQTEYNAFEDKWEWDSGKN